MAGKLGRLRIVWALLVAAFALWLSEPAQASGFYLQDQSARASGRAYSGEAADQGADQLWWNPAAIAGTGVSELDGNLAGILVWSTATDRGSSIDRFGHVIPLGGGPAGKNILSNGIVPNADAAFRLDKDWALGLALTSPFSFATQYGPASFARYAARTTRLQTIDIQPSLAWRPAVWLGLGAGLNIERSLAALSSALPNLSPLEGDATDTLHGSGWNSGYNLGLQLHLLDDHLVVGAAYRSPVHHSLSGSLDVAGLSAPLVAQNSHSNGARAEFTTPWAATLSMRLHATRQLTLDLQLVRSGWSEFDALRITRPVGETIEENYHDVTTAGVGADLAVTGSWVLRTGAQYDPTPTTLDGRNPAVPDANRWLLSLGTSLQLTDRLSVDAAALYLCAQPSHIDRNASAYVGTPLFTPIQIDGEVTVRGLVLALGSRLQF